MDLKKAKMRGRGRRAACHSLGRAASFPRRERVLAGSTTRDNASTTAAACCRGRYKRLGPSLPCPGALMPCPPPSSQLSDGFTSGPSGDGLAPLSQLCGGLLLVPGQPAHTLRGLVPTTTVQLHHRSRPVLRYVVRSLSGHPRAADQDPA